MYLNLVKIKCNGDKCPESIGPCLTNSEANRLAANLGWTRIVSVPSKFDRHYCPDHKTE